MTANMAARVSEDPHLQTIYEDALNCAFEVARISPDADAHTVARNFWAQRPELPSPGVAPTVFQFVKLAFEIALNAERRKAR